MKINFELTFEDWLNFNKYYYSSSKEFNRSILFMRLFVPIPIILLLILRFFQNSLDITTTILSLSFGLLWFYFYPKRFYKEVLKKTEKLMKEGDNSSILGLQSILFDEQGLTCIGQDSTQSYKWSAIKKAVETKNHFFLFNTTLSAIIIPKNAIPTEVENLRNIINQNITTPILQQN